MSKTILVTGATDGIGLETVKMLLEQQHNVLLHGRNPSKLNEVTTLLKGSYPEANIETYIADLTDMDALLNLAQEITNNHSSLDVIINNAGVFAVANAITKDGLDARFVVNTIAPYLLTQKLLPLLNKTSRVVNLSSAAQDTVNIDALNGKVKLSDGAAYAQSKLALTMWSNVLAEKLKDTGPVIFSVNPASMLGSKMVKDAFGVAGGDLSIGADILCRAALSDEFAQASGLYFDNDIGEFSLPHPDAQKPGKAAAVSDAIDLLLAKLI